MSSPASGRTAAEAIQEALDGGPWRQAATDLHHLILTTAAATSGITYALGAGYTRQVPYMEGGPGTEWDNVSWGDAEIRHYPLAFQYGSAVDATYTVHVLGPGGEPRTITITDDTMDAAAYQLTATEAMLRDVAATADAAALGQVMDCPQRHFRDPGHVHTAACFLDLIPGQEEDDWIQADDGRALTLAELAGALTSVAQLAAIARLPLPLEYLPGSDLLTVAAGPGQWYDAWRHQAVGVWYARHGEPTEDLSAETMTAGDLRALLGSRDGGRG